MHIYRIEFLISGGNGGDTEANMKMLTIYVNTQKFFNSYQAKTIIAYRVNSVSPNKYNICPHINMKICAI